LVVVIVAMGFHYFLHANTFEALLMSGFVGFGGIWRGGGSQLWARLSLLWRTLLIVIAAAALFTCIAIGERHRPGALWAAAIVTSAAVVVLLLYWPFSRAMDALWSLWQRRS
jgi:hypothetical protein